MRVRRSWFPRSTLPVSLITSDVATLRTRVAAGRTVTTDASPTVSVGCENLPTVSVVGDQSNPVSAVTPLPERLPTTADPPVRLKLPLFTIVVAANAPPARLY